MNWGIKFKMNLIDQAMIIMQGCKCRLSYSKIYCGKDGLCDDCEIKASQMLIDLTNEKDDFIVPYLKRVGKPLYPEIFEDRLKEINSTIEILGGNK
jgi:hypothetical protein